MDLFHQLDEETAAVDVKEKFKVGSWVNLDTWTWNWFLNRQKSSESLQITVMLYGVCLRDITAMIVKFFDVHVLYQDLIGYSILVQ